MPPILPLLICCAALLIAGELLRRYPRIALGAFVCAPIVGTPIWIAWADQEFFNWIKLYTVLLGMIWLHVYRLGPWRSRLWAARLSLALLVINLIEVAGFELMNGHLIVAGAGALLLVGVGMAGARSVSVSEQAPFDMRWDVPLSWPIAYSLWLLAFAWSTFPLFVGGNLAMLAAAMLVGLRDSALWMQARVLTLSVYMLVVFTWEPAVSRVDWAGWEAIPGAPVVSWLALAASIWAVVAIARARRSNPEEPRTS